MQDQEKVQQLRLTEDQQDRFQLLLSSFLLVTVQNESAQQNLQRLIGRLDENTKKAIYNMCKEDLTARGQRQIAAIKQEIERM